MAHWDGCPRPKATRKVAVFLALHHGTGAPELDSLDFSSDRPFGAEKRGELGVREDLGLGTVIGLFSVVEFFFCFFSPIFWRLPKMAQEMRIV